MPSTKDCKKAIPELLDMIPEERLPEVYEMIRQFIEKISSEKGTSAEKPTFVDELEEVKKQKSRIKEDDTEEPFRT